MSVLAPEPNSPFSECPSCADLRSRLLTASENLARAAKRVEECEAALRECQRSVRSDYVDAASRGHSLIKARKGIVLDRISAALAASEGEKP